MKTPVQARGRGEPRKCGEAMRGFALGVTLAGLNLGALGSLGQAAEAPQGAARVEQATATDLPARAKPSVVDSAPQSAAPAKPQSGANLDRKPAASLSPEQEIERLIAELEQSGCRFERNGSWHDSKAAAAHLRKKYEYLRKKGLVSDAESFIRKGASESSMSGKPYRVQCDTATPETSAKWLGERLRAARAERGG